MTMVEVIAIIATGVLCVLCIVCIAAAVSSRRQVSENSRAIKDIEKSLGTFGDSIKEKTDQLIESLEKQQPDEEQTIRLELLEEEIRKLSESLEDAARGTEIDTEAGDGTGSAEMIEELDDEIELDDLLRELNALSEEEQTQDQEEVPPEPDPVAAAEQPVIAEPAITEPVREKPVIAAPEEPTRYHRGYNIGRSGKKYTAEELNMLIRE